jgi:LmbE family N-acetylglucosaminyl deacetylase
MKRNASRWVVWLATLAVATLVFTPRLAAQQAPRALVAVWAHADDEAAAAPVLARYAREGARVHLIIVTDGAQGGMRTTIPRGPELARARIEEARCSAEALGAQAPILLGFPDAQLGSYVDDPMRLFHVTARLQKELERLQPGALITWGPDGGSGHPDHRIVSSIVTQLVRAGAPGAPERLFYASLPIEGMRALQPSREAPPFLFPLPKHFTVRVSYTSADLEASFRSLACHKTQFTDELLQRVVASSRTIDTGALAFGSAFPAAAADDLFAK